VGWAIAGAIVRRQTVRVNSRNRGMSTGREICDEREEAGDEWAASVEPWEISDV
jgi:hypothetical protein